jgi:DNA polymerase III subunit epsilon
MGNKDDDEGREESPPRGSPWDLPIDETPFAFIDLELTGLNPKLDAVIEVSITRVLGASATTFTSFVRPPEATFLRGGNTHVHGLTYEALLHAPTFQEVLPRIAELLAGAVLVAHGAKTDVAFLEAESARVNATVHLPHFLDTLTLTRRSFHITSYALHSVCAHLGMPSASAHRAEADVDALRFMWPHILKALEPKTARDLWEVRVAQKKARTEILDACQTALSDGKPVRITYRPSRKPAQEFDFVITHVTAEPPHVTGYFLQGRGRRELRPDRILKVDAVDGKK